MPAAKATVLAAKTATPAPIGAAPLPSNMKLIAWGASTNDPNWNRVLNVQDARQGCSSPPERCMIGFKAIQKGGTIKNIHASMVFDPVTAVDYARQYSEASRNAPWLAEVGIDDFAGQYRKAAAKVGAIQAEAILEGIIGNMKAANPDLGFGITLYEDELDSPFLHDPQFPQRLRSRVDYVHFYIHYRSHGPAFASYMQSVTALFPNAKIIGGVYAYDRQDFLPCAPRNPQKCSTAEEASLFAQTTKIEARLLKNGTLDALETIPGYFGRDAEIPDWKTDPRSCAPERRGECIQNTIALRRSMLAILQAAAAAP